jgi:hypothetical protein
MKKKSEFKGFTKFLGDTELTKKALFGNSLSGFKVL